MNTFVADPTCGGTSSGSMGAAHAYTHHTRHHQRWPNSNAGLSLNVEWRQDGIWPHDNNSNDAMCVEEGPRQVETRCRRWNPTSLHILEEDNHPVEWLPLSDEDDDMQESTAQVASPSNSITASASTSLLWYHSRLPSASSTSTSLDSLGLHHPTPSPVSVNDTHYDRMSFPPNSTGIQPELSELDITQISPLSGNPLINWHSPTGFSYYTTTMREDEIESLLGRKRPREGESEDLDMVSGCKRRRRPGLWV